MPWVIEASDRVAFKRCRRAWDFGARSRQNYEPIPLTATLDVGRAIRDALAVYYFPGMWQWSREIVQPLAIKGFYTSLERQRARCPEAQLTPEEQIAWNEQAELGQQMLKRYFEWGPALDRFAPVRVETDFLVNIPDPVNPGWDLVTALGEPVQYRGRIDLLVVDEDKKYWLLHHRIAPAWSNLEHLFLEDEGLAFCWAWENFFLGMRIEGVIYNELRLRLPSPDRPAGSAGPRLDRVFELECNQWFRRTRIPRASSELKAIAEQLALEALDMVSPDLRIYPNPSDESCAHCAFHLPCVAVTEGSDTKAILSRSYRNRAEPSEYEQLGGAHWSVGRGAAPPQFGPGRAWPK